MSPPLCRCSQASHERKDCRLRPILTVRAELYRELFDTGIKPLRIEGVRVLNPGYRGDDPASRRFALLEIDDL
jgi:hypothetical protein